MGKRLRFLIYLAFAAPLTLLALVVNARLYTGHLDQDVAPQLRFIWEALDDGAGEDMQSYFPEGYFFSHVLYGLAWIEVGLRQQPGSPLHEQALREARWALAWLDSPAGRAPFSPDLEPPYGVFYVGWSNWLRGGVLKLQPADRRDSAEVERFESDSSALATAFDRSPIPFLQAYPRQSWPVDSAVAIASLSLHDALFSPRFTATIERWIKAAQESLDPATGLLPHRVDYQTGAILEGARGSSQSLIARFLVEIEANWGREQYRRFRDIFVTTIAGIPGVREYPPGVNGGGDVDSGPLIAGVSLSASTVAVAAAQVQGDSALAEPFLNVGEALGLPIQWGDSKRYALGLLPIGDAFLAWAKSSTAWINLPPPESFPPIVEPGWRIPFHAATLLLLAALWWPIWRSRRNRKATAND